MNISQSLRWVAAGSMRGIVYPDRIPLQYYFVDCGHQGKIWKKGIGAQLVKANDLGNA